MLAKTNGSIVYGVEATTITVEVNAGGQPQEGKNYYQLTGLPDNAVNEGFSQIESTIKNCRYTFPRLFMVVNFAPADIREEGSAYDLPIAVGIVAPVLYKYIKNEEITNNELKEIRLIAESCAREVGPSKYYAASILQGLEISFTEPNCILLPDTRESKSVNEDVQDGVRVAPYDLIGRLIKNNLSQFDIYTVQLPTGIYIIRSTDTLGNITSKKIFKL